MQNDNEVPMHWTYYASVFSAIETRYISPSNTRPARIKATANGFSVTVSYNHSLNADQNHARAALTLRNRMGWAAGYALVAASLDAQRYVFMYVPSAAMTDDCHEVANRRRTFHASIPDVKLRDTSR